jgi:NADH:ubiquinone oxidoreductase subunit 3 (subunit A)
MRNLIKTYQEKDSMFECGFHSFQQSRSPFNIAFFIYALVYLLLDLEILLTFPFAVSEYVNNIYGLIITLGFITIITIGFVFELGKGALKIPSKQYTYTIKNQPLIHISYIKTKSAEITKPHPFITSPPLQSSIFPFTMSMKKIRKYLTFNNIIIGLISLIVMGLVKTLHIPMYILNFLNLEDIESLEYIIAGIFGIVSRLGLRGLIEGIFVDNYATMGGEDPTQGSSSPEGVNNTQRGGGSSSGADTQTQGAGQNSSTNPSVNKDYSAERKAIVFDKAVQMLIEDVKNLNLSMQKTEDDQKWADLRDQVDETMEMIKMVSKASAEEVQKWVSGENTDSTATKRDYDALEEEGEPSKKK